MRRLDYDGALARLSAAPFTRRDATAAGITRWMLDQAIERGRIERLAHGLYRKADATPVDLELAEAVMRAPNATLCLVSALAHHGLIDEIPRTIDLAITSAQRRPVTTAPIAWHRFPTTTFDLGRETIPIEGTDWRIGIYSAERSIVDAFRLRHVVGYEVSTEALRAWLRRPGSMPSAILALADRLPRSQGPLRTALEHLA